MSLLKQIRSALPTARDRIVYLSPDLEKAKVIAQRVRDLNIASVKYVISLNVLEPRPKDGDPKQATYDLLISALEEVTPILEKMPEVETISV